MPKSKSKTKPKSNSQFTVELKDLLEDIAHADNTMTGVNEANGDHRSNLKAILDKRGYHKKAFADFRAMQGMSDSKFADYFRTFSAMFEAYQPEATRRIQDMIEKSDKESSEMEKDLA